MQKIRVNGEGLEIMVPDYGIIRDLCLIEMKKKFEDYGNSWVDAPINWDDRVFYEADEFKKAQGVAAKKRKLLNLINVAAMAYERL